MRVLAPAGPLIIMTAPAGSRLDTVLALGTEKFNITALGPEQVAEGLHSAGMAIVHTRRSGSLLWIEATKQAESDTDEKTRNPK